MLSTLRAAWMKICGWNDEIIDGYRRKYIVQTDIMLYAAIGLFVTGLPSIWLIQVALDLPALIALLVLALIVFAVMYALALAACRRAARHSVEHSENSRGPSQTSLHGLP